MPAHAYRFSRWLIALTAVLLLTAAPRAAAHGGVTIAQGQSKGVTVLVQGSAATTPSGGGAADLATTLAGPGTGEQATVTYWVRPQGGKTFKVETERDASGVRHAEISTAERGDWQAWDVAAVVKLSDGRTVRVSNDASNPPGPAAATPTPTPEFTQAPKVSTAPQATTASETVEDISGESDGAPSWVLPSIIAVLALAAVGMLLARRRGTGSGDGHDAGDGGDDWGSGGE
jgi:hypothetical protein